MATTYTTNYNLGKQENHADKFDMDVITDNADKIDAALTAKADKSTTYTKTEVDTALSGKQATLTTAQLAAVNSGIDSDDVDQITTNKNNISKFQSEIVSIDLTQLNFTQSGQGMYYSDPIALTNIKTILGWTVYDINNLKPTNMFMVAQKSNIAGYFRLLSSNTDFFSGGAGLNAEIQIRIFGTTDNP